MTLLTVVNEVAAVIGVEQKTVLVGIIDTDRTAFELFALANEMAERIAGDLREWTFLRKSGTFIGDGVTEAFNLPADYRRLLINSNVWRSPNAITPMRFIPDTDEWNQRRVANYAAPWGEWTIFGGQMHIWPIMDLGVVTWANNTAYKPGDFVDDQSGPPIDPPPDPLKVTFWRCQKAHTSIAAPGTMATDRTNNPKFWSAQDKTKARFSYLSKYSIALSSVVSPGEVSVNSDRFQSDGDIFRLGERLLKLGMIWQWKANKGSQYAEDMGSWEDAMQMAIGTDSPSPILIGRMPISSTARYAYPFPIPDGMVPL